MRTPFRAAGAGMALVLAAVLLWTPTPTALAATNNLGLRLLQFRIINNTGLDENLYLFVRGQLAPENVDPLLWKWYYQSNVNGDVTQFPKMDTPAGIGLNLGKGKTIDVMLPQLAAMRIYFSLSEPIYMINTAPGASPSVPCGWCPADKNYNTLYDWAEVTWLKSADPKFTTEFGINATQVDLFGFAMFAQLTGSSADGTPGTVKKFGFQDTGARPMIFSRLAAAGAPWSDLVINKGMVPLRVIAPYHGMEILTVFPTDFLNGYINKVWSRYASRPLKATTGNPPRTYNGMVGDKTPMRLVFTQASGPSPADPPFSFDKPTTKAAFENGFPVIECGDTDSPQCIRARAIGALLGGAFMRTVLLLSDNLNACKVNTFYTDDPINKYAKEFHRFAYRHLAYSFGFDDTCEQSSFILLHDPTNLRITLQPFK